MHHRINLTLLITNASIRKGIAITLDIVKMFAIFRNGTIAALFWESELSSLLRTEALKLLDAFKLIESLIALFMFWIGCNELIRRGGLNVYAVPFFTHNIQIASKRKQPPHRECLWSAMPGHALEYNWNQMICFLLSLPLNHIETPLLLRNEMVWLL